MAAPIQTLGDLRQPSGAGVESAFDRVRVLLRVGKSGQPRPLEAGNASCHDATGEAKE